LLPEKGRELRLIEFLAILAALLGIVYSVFPAQPVALGNFPVNSLLAAYLLFFMMYSAFAYTSMLRGRPNAQPLAYGSLALFSILLAFEFVLAVYGLIVSLSATVVTEGLVVFFAAVLGVFFLLYYLLARTASGFLSAKTQGPPSTGQK
jgi:hypothetical protein